MEKDFDVQIITQNVDNLHERAGSQKVLHLHGELAKARSTANESYVVEINGARLDLGDLCPMGSQLRPHIVWFGEMVPEMENAQVLVREADLLLVIGTSLNVYPANSLLLEARNGVEVVLIAPGDMSHASHYRFEQIKSTAVEAVPNWVTAMRAKSAL